MREARNDQRLTEIVSAEIFVVKQGPSFWESVRDWGENRGYVSQKDRGILNAAINGLPSEKQAEYICRLWERLHGAGCPIEPPEP